MNQASTPKRALIVGGGIAGPVLAIFLKRAGIEAVIYESRPEPRDDAGGFLGLAPNGRDVLGTLGIRDEIDALSIPTPRIAFLNHKGKQLGKLSQPMMTVDRGLLNKGLREAAMRRGIPVEFGKRLEDARTTNRNPVAARFDDGSEVEGDFLVGCDGIHSRTRRSILPDAPKPEYTGIIGSGGYTRLSSVPPSGGVMYMTFCLKGFFGYQVLDSGEIYWFEDFHQSTEPDQRELDATPNDRWRRELLDLHHPDHEPIPDIVRHTRGKIVRHPVYEMPVLPSWHKGRVCLTGDAAHAMGPHTGQGASMAMEDAIVLAWCLRDIPDVEQAFAAYQSIRKERVEFVARETRRTGNSKKPPGTFGRLTRDLVLPILLKKGVKPLASVYANHIDWKERVAA